MLLPLQDLPATRICKSHFWSNSFVMEGRVRVNRLSVLIFNNWKSADYLAAHPVVFLRVNYRCTEVGTGFWKSSGP